VEEECGVVEEEYGVVEEECGVVEEGIYYYKNTILIIRTSYSACMHKPDYIKLQFIKCIK